MSYREVLQLPLKTFWLFGKQIGRVLAEVDLRKLRVGIVAQAGGEEVTKLQDELILEMQGTTPEKAQLEAELDVEGLNDLRMMAR